MINLVNVLIYEINIHPQTLIQGNGDLLIDSVLLIDTEDDCTTIFEKLLHEYAVNNSYLIGEPLQKFRMVIKILDSHPKQISAIYKSFIYDEDGNLKSKTDKFSTKLQ